MCAHTHSEYLNSTVLWHNTISRLSEFMRNAQKTILAILTALTLSALAAVIFTWQWGDYRARLRAMRSNLKQQQALVDTHALDTAEQLSQLAESRREKTYAQEALRLADYSVDAAFAAALQDAAQNPAPLTPQTRQITERLKAAEAAVAGGQGRVTQLNQQIAKASEKTKESLQQQLSLAQAQLELDQDELDDAHQDLIRAGGDKQATIQHLRDQHEASQKAAATQASASSSASTAPSVELTKSSSLVA
jgi:PAS domain-containing protein